ncbi:hypothetical protein V8C35DRAFT_126336 [Trichoderma chlorosporum]
MLLLIWHRHCATHALSLVPVPIIVCRHHHNRGVAFLDLQASCRALTRALVLTESANHLAGLSPWISPPLPIHYHAPKKRPSHIGMLLRRFVPLVYGQGQKGTSEGTCNSLVCLESHFSMAVGIR